MMKRYLFALLLITQCTMVKSQVFTAIVIDENHQPLAHVRVKDTVMSAVCFTNLTGVFSIKISPESVFEFSSYDRQTLYLKTPELTDTIQLFKTSTVLAPVTVRGKRIKPVLDVLNINVLDYIPDQNGIIVLHTTRQLYQISLIEYDGNITTFTLGKIKPKSLFKDCYGNIHLITKSAAIQIWLGHELQMVATVPITSFIEVLKPCIGQFDNTFFINSTSNHHQKYTIGMKTKGEAQFRPIFETWDRTTEKAAAELYSEILGLYMTQYNDTVSNLILNDAWDGDLLDLAVNHELITRIGFYEKNLAKTIDVKSFTTQNSITTFDIAFDSIHQIDKSGKIFRSVYCNFNRIDKIETIIHDENQHQFYVLSIKGGFYSVQKVDINTGLLAPAFQLNALAFPEQVKVYAGWLYFLDNRSGFKKLYRLKL